MELFRDLDIAELEGLSRLLNRKTFQAGSVLMTKEQVGEAVYVIVDGSVKIFLVDENGKEVTLAIHEGLVGTVVPMLIEGVDSEGRLVGRTHRDAPEIDGTTYATTTFPAFAGDLVNVRITRVDPYDLHGEVVWGGGCGA